MRFCRHISMLIILSHWSNQIEEKRNEGSTSSLFEYDLKWVCGVKSPVLISWDHLRCNFRKLQRVLGQKILNTTRNNNRIYRNKIRVVNNGKLTYRLNKSRNIVAVKYWLVKFFTIDVQLHKDRHRVNVKYRHVCQLNIHWQLKI